MSIENFIVNVKYCVKFLYKWFYMLSGAVFLRNSLSLGIYALIITFIIILFRTIVKFLANEIKFIWIPSDSLNCQLLYSISSKLLYET
jgi:hypothetical protein